MTASNKIKVHLPQSAFFKVSGIGWTLFILINIFFQSNYFTTNPRAVPVSIIGAVLGFSLTLGMRYVILKFNLIYRQLGWVVPILLGISILAGILVTLIFEMVFVVFTPWDTHDFDSLLGNTVNMTMIFWVWSLIYAGYLFFENQQRLFREKLQLSLQLKEAELNNLRKQLSPHFLFNTLNNIRSLILIDQEKARDALLDVSDMLRYALSYQNKHSVTVEEEMEIVQGYINLNQIHLGDNAQFDLKVDDDLLNLTIPPMSIQLLVENAIKHGSLNQGGKVSILVGKSTRGSKIEVSNPGTLKEDAPKGIGLTYLKQRLVSLFGDRVTFEIFSKDERVIAQIVLS